MKIEMKYNDLGSKWIEIDEKTCLKYTENAGYYKWGTVIDMLENGCQVLTPFAIYRNKKL